MKKFGQILALVFVLAFGYGLGQQSGILWATDYPTGGGGSTPNALTNTVGQNGIHNTTAANETLQHAASAETATTSTDTTVGLTNTTVVTFGTAFSASPTVVAIAQNTSGDLFGISISSAVSTTTFTARVAGTPSTVVDPTIHYIAID